MSRSPWYHIDVPEAQTSPSLLVYPERIARNIEQMINIAAGVEFLRPHVKTHKMAEIINMQQQRGIDKFKCATIAEAELLGACRADDVLLSIQPVGPNIERLFAVMNAYPETTFATIVDNETTAGELNQKAADTGRHLRVYLDINAGMNRTGITPGHEGKACFRNLFSLTNLIVNGFHVYDGHIRNPDLKERTEACNNSFAAVLNMKKELQKDGFKVENIIAGGSPTFPIHARRKGVEASPGTTLLWDEGYGSILRDMDFLPAAVVLTRIISKPEKGIVCLDLGHKSIAPEMPFPRVRLLGMEHCEQVSQSEEHLVLRCPDPENYEVGQLCYGIPMHICPTVAKYPEVLTVEKGVVTGSWKVAARDHRLTI